MEQGTVGNTTGYKYIPPFWQTLNNMQPPDLPLDTQSIPEATSSNPARSEPVSLQERVYRVTSAGGWPVWGGVQVPE